MNELFAAFGVEWKLLLAQAINFGIVLLVLWYFLYRPVLAMLEKRRALVAKGVEDAAKAEAKLSTADEIAATIMQKAEAEAEAVMQTARAKGAEERAKIVQDAQSRASQLAKDAEARAEESIKRAQEQSEKEIARLALLAAEKIMKSGHD